MDNKQENLLQCLSDKSSLDEIQEYIAKIMKIRGFTGQTEQDKLMLLIEEVGELAKALRKQGNYLAVDQTLMKHYTPVKEELADVFIVLMSLCDILNISLWDSFYFKEGKNVTRRWD